MDGAASARQGGTAAPGGGPLRLRVLVRPGAALGLRLAGAAVEEVPAGEEAAALRGVLADPQAGVLAIDEAVLAGVPEGLLHRARARGVPVVLPFAMPRRFGDAGGEAYVAALIRRAVGYGVKLGGTPAGGGR